MGTRFREYFENDEFSRVIHSSATKLFASCVGDLTVFAVGLIVDREKIDDEQARTLALELFGTALMAGVSDEDRAKIPSGARREFEARIEKLIWRGMSNGERAFVTSLDDLIRFAPVVDEFKGLDSAIVRNSIRFRRSRTIAHSLECRHRRRVLLGTIAGGRHWPVKECDLGGLSAQSRLTGRGCTGNKDWNGSRPISHAAVEKRPDRVRNPGSHATDQQGLQARPPPRR